MAAQPCLAQQLGKRGGGRGAAVGAGPVAGGVVAPAVVAGGGGVARGGEVQGGQRGRAERGGGAGDAVALALLAQVDRGRAGREAFGEPFHQRVVRCGRPAERPDLAGERGVGGVIADEVGGDPVRYPQRPAEEGAFALLDHDQAERGQRCRRVEAGAALGAVRGHPAQVEREADGRPAAADVVVEVAVERFEGAVEVGGEHGEQDAGVQRGQAEPGGELVQPVAVGPDAERVAERAVGPVAERAALLRRGRAQRMPYRFVGQVQAAQRVGGGRVGGAAVLHEQGDPVAQSTEPADQGVRVRVRASAGAGVGGRAGGGYRGGHSAAPGAASLRSARWRGRW